jgi:4-hydroxyphenylpyruvate dioxygenase
MKHNQLAINSASTGSAAFDVTLSAYEAAGFRHVEFVLGHVRDFLAEDHTPDDTRALIEGRGLSCIGGFDGKLLCFADAARRRVNHDRVVDNAELLAALGGTKLVVGTDGPPDPGGFDDPLGRVADVFRMLAERIGETGVDLCLEFNWSPLVKSLRSAVEVAVRSGAANVGVLFDPAHYHCTPTKFDQINAASVPYVKHVHVNDMRDKPGELSHCNDDRVLPGEGCLDLSAIFGALEEHGYRGLFSIEMFSEELWALPPVEAAERMYESMQTYCE